MKPAALALSLCAAALLSACASLGHDASKPTGAAYADYLIGRYADLLHNDDVAADRYLLALARAPHNGDLMEDALYATLADGDAARALVIARYAQQRDLDVAAARLVRAAEAMRAGRWSAAEAALDDLSGNSLEEMTARLMRIWVQAGKGDPAAAAEDFARISAPRPFDGVIDYERAMALTMAGDEESALAAYAQARDGEMWLAPAALYEAALLAREGRHEEIAAPYEQRTARLRDPALAAYLSNGEAPPRLTAARGAAIGLYGLAALLMQEADNSRGLSVLTLAVMLDPQLDPAKLLFADGLSDRGRYDRARLALRRIEATSPYIDAARAAEAWTLHQEGREEEALALAEQAAQRGGRTGLTTLADLQRSNQRWAHAEETYTRLINSLDGPDAADWPLYFSRGAARERLQRFEDAELDFRRALELQPDQPETLNYLGYSWIDRGVNMEEGMLLIQRAVELRPTSGHIIDSLGWAHFRRGDYDIALGYLERAVELEPADSVLNDHLGDALWRVGRRTEARFQWSRALALATEAEARGALEQKLASGLPAAPSPESAQARNP